MKLDGGLVGDVLDVPARYVVKQIRKMQKPVVAAVNGYVGGWGGRGGWVRRSFSDKAPRTERALPVPWSWLCRVTSWW